MTPTPFDPDARAFAVVTGASSGIGLAIARHLARQGWDLLISASRDDHLVEAERALREAAPDRVVRRHAADLIQHEGVESLVAAYRAICREEGRRLDGLVANAGIGRAGAFVETPLEEALKVVDLNVRSQVHLIRRALDDMAEGGRILLTSSIAALAPGPHIATYNASKAFLRSFGLALREELKDGPVSLTVLMPSAADTAFWEKNGMEDVPLAKAAIDEPDFIGERAVAAMLEERATVLPGTSAKLGAVAGKIAPGRLSAAILSGAGKPKS